MEIKKASSYDSIKYRSFPRDTKDKDQLWYLGYVQSMFHRYRKGLCEHKFESSYLRNLELYAKGEQGAKKVKEKMLRQQKDGTFKGFTKDVFQTFDILPELIDIMMSTNMRADYNPSAVAIDKNSLVDKDTELGIAKFLVQEQTKDFLKYMGIKVDSVLTDDEIAIYNDSDVDVLFKTGGIQLQREIDAIAACNDSMIASRHKEIENLNTFDLITYGIAGTRTYIDYSEDNVKYRYVDPKRLIIPKSKYNDFRDISYAGELIFMRLHEIVSQCPSLRPDQIEELIRGNFRYNEDFVSAFDEIGSYSRGIGDVFDEFVIPVVDAQWLATDEEVYLQTSTSNGGFMYKNVKTDYELTKKQEKKGASIDRKKYVKRYHAKWVVGSEILLDYGVAKDNTYYGPKGKRIPKLDYSIVKTGKKSLVDRARTSVDDLNLNVAKHRSAIASLPPGPGLIIYEHALQNIKFGGKLQTPKDLISGLTEGGVLIINGRDSKGNYIVSNGGKAVESIPATAIQQIAVFTNEITAKVNQLRQLLGLPEGLDGTAGNQYAGVGQVELAAAASANAHFPTLSMIGPLYEITLDKSVSLWQIHSKDGDKELRNSTGKNGFKTLSLSKDFSNYDFRITIIFSPTDEEKRFLIDQVNQMALAYVQTNGNIGCSKAEFFMLYKLIKSNLLDEAMYQVARIEKLREQNNVRIHQENIQANAQQNNDSIRLNSEAKIAEEQEKARLKILSDSNKSNEEKIRELSNTYLKSFERESAPIPSNIYSILEQDAEMKQQELLSQVSPQAPPEQQIQEDPMMQPMQ